MPIGYYLYGQPFMTRGSAIDQQSNMNRYDLKKKDDNWVLQKQGATKASINFGDSNKTEATQGAAKFLRNQPTPASLLIHKENGGYQEERTYPRSADPRRSAS